MIKDSLERKEKDRTIYINVNIFDQYYIDTYYNA